MSDGLSILKNTDSIFIFGAQSRGKTLLGLTDALFTDVRVRAFLYDDDSENDDVINGVPVCTLAEYEVRDDDVAIPVFIATKGEHHGYITRALKGRGFRTVIPITPELDNELRRAYAEKVLLQLGLNVCCIEEIQAAHITNPVKATATVYCAESQYDRPLETDYDYPEYEVPIRVGAALAPDSIRASLRDDVGDNISHKNRQYCELTALYWAWKNSSSKYIGISHYRRHFVLPDDWADRMEASKIDAVLPVPTPIFPTVQDNYIERHDSKEWNALLEAIVADNEYEGIERTALEVFSGTLYFPCNMLIARREVLAELCEWMFPIIDGVVGQIGDKEDSYARRYPGFMSERLITVFMMHNRDRLNIALADKMFIR